MNRSLLLSLLALSLLFVAGCDAEVEVEGDEAGECDDGVDNDQDGALDCDDDGCAIAAACAGDDDDTAGDDDDTAGDDDDTTGDDDDSAGDDDDDAAEDDDSAGDDDDSAGDDDDSSAGTDADGDGVTVEDGDCDDGESANFPGNTEVCDGADNDCNGLADYGASTAGDDDDSAGPILASGESDFDGDGFLACIDDCDDESALVYPRAPEVWNDSIDQDCDGAATGLPELIVQPVILDLGSVPQNQAPLWGSIGIENVGTTVITIDSVELEPDPLAPGSEGLFTIGGFSGGMMQPGTPSESVSVELDPGAVAEGTKSAVLVIHTGAPDLGRVDVPLTAVITEDCVACGPIVQVVGGTVVDLIAEQVTYIQVATGLVTVQILNVGSGPLPMTPISEGFGIFPDHPGINYQSGAPAQIAPGGSSTLVFDVAASSVESITFDGVYGFTLGTFPPDATVLANESVGGSTGPF